MITIGIVEDQELDKQKIVEFIEKYKIENNVLMQVWN